MAFALPDNHNQRQGFQAYGQDQHIQNDHNDTGRLMQENGHGQLEIPYCLQQIFSNLSDNSARRKLMEFEFYPNWICLNGGTKFNPRDLDAMWYRARSLSNEDRLVDVKGDQLVLQGLSPIIWTNTLAFIKIMEGQFDKADEHLTESNRLIDIFIGNITALDPSGNPDANKGYLVGLFYIVKGLKLVIESHNPSFLGGQNLDFNQFLLVAVENFEELARKSRIAVLASKLFFLDFIRPFGGNYKTTDIQELIFMDSDYFEWRLYQYLTLRRSRKANNVTSQGKPDIMEIQAIQHAWNIGPYNPYSVVYTSLCVAECLAAFINEENNETLIVGQFEFKTIQQAAVFVIENCRKVLQNNPRCVKISLIVAEVVADILPFKFRDMQCAQEAIYQAYRAGCDISSNANYRLVKYTLRHMRVQVQTAEVRTTFEAILHKAYMLDPCNESALFDLLLLFLSHPYEREQEILSIFHARLSSIVDISAEFPAKLMFIKGCFHMMMNNFQEAINCWITVHNNRKSTLNFEMFRCYSYVFRVFGWNWGRINLPLMISETNKAIASSTSPSETRPDSRSYFTRKRILIEILKLQEMAHNSDAALNLPTQEL